MKKTKTLLIGLLTLLLLMATACSSTSDDTTDDTTTDDTTSSWYTGPGYDALYEELGKADIDLSEADGLLKEII